MNSLFFKFSIPGFLWAAFGCSTPATIATNTVAQMYALSPEFSVIEDVGSSPISIKSKSAMARFKTEVPGKEGEFILVLYPGDLKGELKIDLQNKQLANARIDYGTYFDQLLRAHRLILRGKLDLAEELLARIDSQHDTTYGSTVLLATIAILRGDEVKSRDLYERAAELRPQTGKEEFFEAVRPKASNSK